MNTMLTRTAVSDDTVKRKPSSSCSSGNCGCDSCNAKSKKMKKVMHEYKAGELHSSSGDKVTNRKQALAIAISEARRGKG